MEIKSHRFSGRQSRRERERQRETERDKDDDVSSKDNKHCLGQIGGEDEGARSQRTTIRNPWYQSSGGENASGGIERYCRRRAVA
jgi:hypothetical protein